MRIFRKPDPSPSYDKGPPTSLAIEFEAARKRISNSPNRLEQIFIDHKGREIHKWIHYLDIYNRLFSRLQFSSVALLEIGIYKGGSLEMWRSFFGADATIFGIDINPECANFVDEPNQARIGSQDDPEFLDRVLEELGRPNIIIDDGSHIANHQIATFRHLFPKLPNGGLYIIEDLHSSYWSELYEGGYNRSGTAIELVKCLIDDLHGWHHSKGSKYAPKETIGSLTIHDSIVVIEKAERMAPVDTKVGG